ncbi:hypothetical protein N865_15380 [Intrasporangium oryzae NRRL B-24470]|uniref:Uncharacterized protein n=1 Tax=Intrasporangium oryzae NRRL B-24470 TaxID=1386089 RepID=W9G8V3_9MICO|nr:hypothetical protein [Intrasporangium oryzae]EWT01682.1 hypothetical protein N865_15380 [Intrasporangium oryzae NRRL B-24470]
MTIPPPDDPQNESPDPDAPRPGPPGTDDRPWEQPTPRRHGRKRLLGALAAVVYLAALLGTSLGWSSGATLLVGGVLFGVLAGTVLMAIEEMRPYAAGFLLGLAAVIVVGGGACIGLIAYVSSTV